MEIIRTFFNLKCVECGNTIIYNDLIHNEIYCRSCGLIHNSEMLEQAKKEYEKQKIKEIKERLQKENKEQYNNFINYLKAIEQAKKKKEIKRKLLNNNQMKIKEKLSILNEV